jgi:hypothetical protein
VINHDSVGRGESSTSFAISSEFGCARLIVDEHRDTRGGGQNLLSLDEPRPLPYINFGRPVVVALRVIRGHDDAGDSLTKKVGSHGGWG